MKRFIMTIVVLAGALMSLPMAAAERVVIDEVANHYPWDGKVDCTYTLSGLDAGYSYKGVFTLKVKRGNVKAGKVVTNELASADGTYTNTFDCVALFGAGVYPSGGLALDVVKGDMIANATGSHIGVTGDVLVIDISSGASATGYPTAEFSNVDMGALNCDTYKTTRIALRKIPAGSYYCQPGADESTTVTQKLTTRGFYIGVFPVTQRQYELVMGTNPSNFQVDAADNATVQRPVEMMSWNIIRGSVATGAEITDSSADSFMKRLVAKTGLRGFDLPTEAQWEIACRAGSAQAYGGYWNGSEIVGITSLNFGDVSWCFDNSLSTTHAVGGKCPNSWGLYDMHGNVAEWCRDIYISTYSKSYVDSPCTETSYSSGQRRILRGGSWSSRFAQYCRPSVRSSDYTMAGYNDLGFRLMKSLP